MLTPPCAHVMLSWPPAHVPRMHRRKSRLVKLVEKIHIPVDEWVRDRLGKIQAVKERYKFEQQQKASL